MHVVGCSPECSRPGRMAGCTARGSPTRFCGLAVPILACSMRVPSTFHFYSIPVPFPFLSVRFPFPPISFPAQPAPSPPSQLGVVDSQFDQRGRDGFARRVFVHAPRDAGGSHPSVCTNAHTRACVYATSIQILIQKCACTCVSGRSPRPLACMCVRALLCSSLATGAQSLFQANPSKIPNQNTRRRCWPTTARACMPCVLATPGHTALRMCACHPTCMLATQDTPLFTCMYVIPGHTLVLMHACYPRTYRSSVCIASESKHSNRTALGYRLVARTRSASLHACHAASMSCFTIQSSVKRSIRDTVRVAVGPVWGSIEIRVQSSVCPAIAAPCTRGAFHR